jgi:DNA-3-methyladenine glycosylase
MTRLDRAFFTRDTVAVARDLLGRTLVHVVDGERVAGRVAEVEAYTGWDDEGSHGYGGITPRNAVMFGPAGFSYVYFIYGMYWMFNVVARPPGVDYSGAILVRALEPLEGLQLMAQRRPARPQKEWTSGPARLALALGIAREQNGLDLTARDTPLFFEPGSPPPAGAIRSGPRIGLGSVSAEWRDKPWRFWIDGSPYVSR